MDLKSFAKGLGKTIAIPATLVLFCKCNPDAGKEPEQIAQEVKVDALKDIKEVYNPGYNCYIVEVGDSLSAITNRKRIREELRLYIARGRENYYKAADPKVVEALSKKEQDIENYYGVNCFEEKNIKVAAELIGVYTIEYMNKNCKGASDEQIQEDVSECIDKAEKEIDENIYTEHSTTKGKFPQNIYKTVFKLGTVQKELGRELGYETLDATYTNGVPFIEKK